MKKVALVKNLTDIVLKKLSGKADIVIFLKSSPHVNFSLYPNIHFLDASHYIHEAIDFGFKDVRKKLQMIQHYFPSLFNYKGYNLFYALNKDIFWTLGAFDYYFFEYVLELLKKEGGAIRIVFKEEKYVPIKGIIKIAIFYFSNMLNKLFYEKKNSKNNFPSQILNKKIAIKFDGVEVLFFLGSLPEKIGYDNILAYHTEPMNNSLRKLLKNINIKYVELPFLKVSIEKISLYKLLKMIFYFDIRFVNAFITCLEKLYITINQYEILATFKIKNILIPAGENTGEGNIVGMIGAKFGIRSLNFMNGTKGLDACNQDINFDYWFMHDEVMQQKVHETYNISKEKIPVVGHLMEDIAKKHQYSGRFDEYLHKYPADFIIAFFYSTFFNNEKIALLKYFSKFLNENKKSLIFLKMHPSEQGTENFLTYSNIERLIILPEIKKEENHIYLFDLLSIADVAVSMASTVCYQAGWFDIPSISFEMKNYSRMYFIDGIKYFHCKTISELDKTIKNIMKNKKINKVRESFVRKVPQKTAAEKILEYLL